MSIAWEEVKKEATQILAKLIQFDTTNPPGNELIAANYLATIAEQHGLTAKVIETAPQRGNVIISLNDTYKDPLILLSHLDVVGAQREDWEEDPFAGVIKDDVLWGRGTIDTKQLTVMELMVLLLLKRNQIQLPNDIVLIATADEESGSTYGLIKLLEEYGQYFLHAPVINEGGGFPIMVGETPVYLCETGQKGMCQIRFNVKKQPHANPYYFNNHVLTTSAELVQRLVKTKWESEPPITTQYLIETLVGVSGQTHIQKLPYIDKVHHLSKNVSPFINKLLKAMSENTFAATIWNGGGRHSELLGDSEIFVDCRILPKVTMTMVEDKLRELTQGLDVEWTIESFREGYESDYRTPLFASFQAAMASNLPGSLVVPFISTGGSDSRFLAPYRSKVFGFSPMLPDMTFEKVLPMVHGINERIPLDSLLFGIKVLYESILNYCKKGS